MIDYMNEHAQLVAFSLPLLVFLLALLLWVMLFKACRLHELLSVELHRAENLLASEAANHRKSHLAIDATLNRVEKQLAEITESVFELRSQAALNRSFEEAFRMTRKGVPAQRLVKSCGLSDGEAELMVRLHQG